MSTRSTDPEKWRDPWFRRLPTEAKFVFMWLCDHCDKAGCLTLDEDLIADDLKLDEAEISSAIKKLSTAFKGIKRVQLAKIEGDESEILWLRNFIKVQIGTTTLSPTCNFHKAISKVVQTRIALFPSILTVYDGLTRRTESNAVERSRTASNGVERSRYPKEREREKRESKESKEREGECEGERGFGKDDPLFQKMVSSKHLPSFKYEQYVRVKAMYPKADHETIVNRMLELAELSVDGFDQPLFYLRKNFEKSEVENVYGGKGGASLEYDFDDPEDMDRRDWDLSDAYAHFEIMKRRVEADKEPLPKGCSFAAGEEYVPDDAIEDFIARIDAAKNSG